MPTFTSVPNNAVASAVFIEQQFKKSGSSTSFIPERVALHARFLAAKSPTVNVPQAVTSADDVAAIAGYGSEAHFMAKALFDNMGALPALVDYFPLTDGTTAATGTVVFATNASSAGQWTVYVCGRPVTFSVASGDTPTVQGQALADAITADLTFPASAVNATGTVTFTSKWKGASANLLTLAKNYYGSEVALQPGGTTMTVTTFASGATYPSLPVFSTIYGNTFYTLILIGMNDATTATALETCFTSRVDPGIKKPTVGIMGFTGTYAAFNTAIGSVGTPTRNSPGSCYVPVESSPMYPGQIAAAVAGQVARSANTDPSRPFKTLPLLGILPSTTAAPWTYTQQDTVEKNGGSVTEIVGGQVVIKDLLTTYKVNAGGSADDSWRYVCTVTNIQQKEYSIQTLFTSEPFIRAKVLTDDDVSAGQDYALNPNDVKTYIIGMVDGWIEQKWSKNRDTIVAGITVDIDGTNPGRFNILIPDVIVVGLRIVAVKYTWAFSAA